MTRRMATVDARLLDQLWQERDRIEAVMRPGRRKRSRLEYLDLALAIAVEQLSVVTKPQHAGAVRRSAPLAAPTLADATPEDVLRPPEWASVDCGLTPDSDVCVYCGDWADTRDHLAPRRWSGNDARRWVPTVPACLDCNVRLGDQRTAPTLADRRAVIYGSLLRRSRRLLRGKPWSDAELATVGPRLRVELAARQRRREHTLARLANLRLGNEPADQ